MTETEAAFCNGALLLPVEARILGTERWRGKGTEGQDISKTLQGKLGSDQTEK